ncbi:hypothetical protein Esti_003314 [Eimeria stiedai]
MKDENSQLLEEGQKFKPLRILYLHGIDSGPRSTLARQLRRLYGYSSTRGGVYTPALLIREVLLFSLLVTGLLLLTILAAVIVSWNLASLWLAGLATAVGIGLGGLLVFLASLAAPRLMLSVARSRAARAFEVFKPNVVAASSFGAVVLFHLRIPKLPLLLLSPSQEGHRNFFASRKAYSLRRWPYVLLIHAGGDSNVPLQDSVHLIETAKVGRGRLEVLGETPLSTKPPNRELRWVQEVFERGREEVLRLAEAGSSDVDASLFLNNGDSSEPSTSRPSSIGADSSPLPGPSRP